jgi:WD40 repeat protein
VYSPDGMRIVSGGDDKTVRVWETRTGRLVAGPFHGHSGYVRSVAFSPQGRWVVSCSNDHDVRVWDTEAHKEDAEYASQVASRCFSGHSGAVSSVTFSPDGQWIVSGSLDRTVRIWCLKTGKTELILSSDESREAGDHAVMSVAISPRGDRIIAGKYSGSIYVWSRG